MSAVGSMFTILLLLVKPMTRRFFSPKWQYYVWLMVLFVLLLPVPAKFSATVPAGNIMQEQVSQAIKIQESEMKIQAMPKDLLISPQKALPTPSVTRNMFVKIASHLWCICAILFLTFRIIRYIIFLNALHRNSQKASCAAIKTEKIAVRRTDMLDAPLLVGLFRPVLFLPNMELTKEDLNYIILHEMTHYKRHDLLYKWFAMFVNALHWFNPFVYIVARQIEEECEISCDLSVTADMNEEQQKGYMNMILHVLSNVRAKPRFLTTQMASSKKMLKRRFSMIRKAKKTNLVVAIVSVVLAVFMFSTMVLASGILQNKSTKNMNEASTHFEVDTVAGSKINVLLSCIDSQRRVDSLLVISADKANKNMTILSIPRDTLITKENQRTKISALLSNGRTEQDVIDVVRKDFQIPVNYYLGINLEIFRDIVDMLGGVEFDVPTEMYYPEQSDKYLTLPKGVQMLDGEKAELLLRFRSYPQGDIGRNETILSFLQALIKQKLMLRNMISNDILKEISNNVVTNYPVLKLQEDYRIFKNMDPDKVKVFILPGNFADIEHDAYWVGYWMANRDALQRIVNQYFILQ